ncbi:MAG TPA: hypothetical protein VM261_23610 [Kofleriaceae bacterium]|nr:hypothetical protein [Kofleriaceae bacterium]
MTRVGAPALAHVPVLLLLAACGHSSPASSTPKPSRCPTTPVRVHAQEELDALRGCTTLPGLELRGAVPFDLTPLESLTAIGGDLTFRGTFALGGVRLPALARVGGAVTIVSNLELGGVYLPRLASARSLTITDAPPLLEIMLPALAEIPGDLTFARLPQLELVDLSALPAVGGAFVVEKAPRIATWLGPTETARPTPASAESQD